MPRMTAKAKNTQWNRVAQLLAEVCVCVQSSQCHVTPSMADALTRSEAPGLALPKSTCEQYKRTNPSMHEPFTQTTIVSIHACHS